MNKVIASAAGQLVGAGKKRRCLPARGFGGVRTHYCDSLSSDGASFLLDQYSRLCIYKDRQISEKRGEIDGEHNASDGCLHPVQSLCETLACRTD